MISNIWIESQTTDSKNIVTALFGSATQILGMLSADVDVQVVLGRLKWKMYIILRKEDSIYIHDISIQISTQLKNQLSSNLIFLIPIQCVQMHMRNL
jgi:hypothetical protein